MAAWPPKIENPPRYDAPFEQIRCFMGTKTRKGHCAKGGRKRRVVDNGTCSSNDDRNSRTRARERRKNLGRRGEHAKEARLIAIARSVVGCVHMRK